MESLIGPEELSSHEVKGGYFAGNSQETRPIRSMLILPLACWFKACNYRVDGYQDVTTEVPYQSYAGSWCGDSRR